MKLAADFKDIFGAIKPPPELDPFTQGNLSGATGISKFFSNLIGLIYAVAAVFFLFMILWGAFDWITSEGQKEKVQQAQQKIIHAMIGILLFAAAFAIIAVFGKFTGFSFFSTNSCSPGYSYDSSSKSCKRICFPGEEAADCR